MNLVILHGRLTKDVDIRYSQSSNPVAVSKFSIAVRREFARNGEQDTDFFNCVAFGKTAENIGKFFTKGSGIIVRGRIQIDTIEKDNKSKIYYTNIVVEGFDFAEKVESQSKELEYNERHSNNNTSSNSAWTPSTPTSNFEEDDDLPF